MKIVSGEPKSDLPRILMAYGTFPPSQRLFHLEPNMVNWAHRWIGGALRALGGGLPLIRRRLRKSLDDLDREIRKLRQARSVDCSRAGDDRLDVYALGSTEELRFLIDLYLRGWTSQEIEEKLDRTTSGKSFGG